MSYELKISPKNRASGRFIGKVRKSLIEALIDEKKLSGLNQQKLANALGVNRSVINRMLKGDGNLTLRSIGEIAWAMGWEPDFILRRKPSATGVNHLFYSPVNTRPTTRSNAATFCTIRSADEETTSRSAVLEAA